MLLQLFRTHIHNPDQETGSKQYRDGELNAVRKDIIMLRSFKAIFLPGELTSSCEHVVKPLGWPPLVGDMSVVVIPEVMRREMNTKCEIGW